MQPLQQVTFRFGSEFEVRYVPQMPEIGDPVLRGGATWVVARMDDDATGIVAICELRGARRTASSGASIRE